MGFLLHFTVMLIFSTSSGIKRIHQQITSSDSEKSSTNLCSQELLAIHFQLVWNDIHTGADEMRVGRVFAWVGWFGNKSLQEQVGCWRISAQFVSTCSCLVQERCVRKNARNKLPWDVRATFITHLLPTKAEISRLTLISCYANCMLVECPYSSFCCFSIAVISAFIMTTARCLLNHHIQGQSRLAGTRLSPFRMLLELRTMEVVVTIGAMRHAKLQSNRHYQQLTPSECPSCLPTNSVWETMRSEKEMKPWSPRLVQIMISKLLLAAVTLRPDNQMSGFAWVWNGWIRVVLSWVFV